jgi:hypothetical protein
MNNAPLERSFIFSLCFLFHNFAIKLNQTKTNENFNYNNLNIEQPRHYVSKN